VATESFECDEAGVDQLQQRRARHRLGVRPDPEMIIGGDRLVAPDLATAERLDVCLLRCAEQHDGGGNRHLGHLALDERPEGRHGQLAVPGSIGCHGTLLS